MRGWWAAVDYPTVVCVAFTGVTIVNSVMMVVGWDEPKEGAFAYVHLLSRLAIVTGVVALFFTDEIREWARHRGSAVAWFTRTLDHPVNGFSLLFTLTTATGCVAAIVISAVVEVAGGVRAYWALLTLAAVLAAVQGARRGLRR
ncbi:hypothetical protein BHE97_05955 [Aeromicrobium sp. PE09-221]|uniref:hypothetical protein n=1 Tax=Aeromicrobium sp. PE09-221 TaxID=1898043 RepID=UPI000B3EB6D0|nr:hypothetical protein [Aeromicrobium sp. PE09-221]OUZ10977.1 hypothetical protein BHE97_05955 [Aeromicrobium sp. PE09-221]